VKYQVGEGEQARTHVLVCACVCVWSSHLQSILGLRRREGRAGVGSRWGLGELGLLVCSGNGYCPERTEKESSFVNKKKNAVYALSRGKNSIKREKSDIMYFIFYNA